MFPQRRDSPPSLTPAEVGSLPALRHLMIERKQAKSGSWIESHRTTIVERIRGILRSKSLTLYKVSVWTRTHYSGQPSYYIPRNLYFQLRSARWTPTIQQALALSQVSGHPLADWLEAFGFRLDELSYLQVILRYPRTVLLDATVYDRSARVPWFRDRTISAAIPGIAPLSQLLAQDDSTAVGSLIRKEISPYFYAKIGQRDAYAFPDLLPGSIVRVDSRRITHPGRPDDREISNALFLVEHGRGLCCCRLHFGLKDRITLTSTALPYSNVELQLGSEARILGVVDLEIRSLSALKRSMLPRCAEPEVAPELTKLWTPVPLNSGFPTVTPFRRMRNARRRVGLSLRQASEMSREVAHTLADEGYFTSPGSLSEYEASDTPPRHIHKLLTLAIVYSIPFAELLGWFGLRPERRQTEEFPQATEAPDDSTNTPGQPGFLSSVLRQIGELPVFLRRSMASLSGLHDVSLRDVFWVGGEPLVMHPSLGGALFIIVDRRKKRPRIFPHKGSWEQPIYLLRKSDESYLMASCNQEDGTIVLHPYTREFTRAEQLRKTAEAEVVGQIVTIIRALPK